MDSRTENGTRNILTGFANRILLIVFPFITRTVLIRVLGSEYLGLNSLFTSILTVLNLAELGFGSALVYSMYKPIAENDKMKIRALLYLYKKIYTIIGLLILLTGLAITPFIPNIIKGSVPEEINIYIIYLIYLFNTVISYLFFAHRRALIIAYQRNDITNNTNSIISIFLYLMQIITLLLSHNYYIYIVLMPMFTIIDSLLVAKESYRIYPDIMCCGLVSKEEKSEIKNHIKGLALQNICSASRNALDSIVISLYLGLKSIAVYNNYYFIMNAVHSFLYQIPNSIRSSVGNSIASESVKKNYKLFNVMTLAYQWIAGWCLVCLLCLYQPFMKIWMGENMLCPFSTVILLCVYFFELCLSDIIVLYKDGAGLWWHGRYRTIIEAIANLVLNFLLGKYLGLNGIIIATIITMTVIGHGYGGYIVFHYYFVGEKYSKYIFQQLSYFAIVCLVGSISYFVCNIIIDTGIVSFITKILLCLIVPNICFYFIYRKNEYYTDAKCMVNNILNSIMKKRYKNA